MAAQCFAAGRIDDAVGYAETGLEAIGSGRFDQVPHKFEASLSGPYITIGPPERWVELCRNMIARWPDTHTYALARPGSGVEGLLAAADATDNPHVVSLGAPRERLCPPRRRSLRRLSRSLPRPEDRSRQR
jgi:hypothetical protein